MFNDIIATPFPLRRKFTKCLYFLNPVRKKKRIQRFGLGLLWGRGGDCLLVYGFPDVDAAASLLDRTGVKNKKVDIPGCVLMDKHTQQLSG